MNELDHEYIAKLNQKVLLRNLNIPLLYHKEAYRNISVVKSKNCSFWCFSKVNFYKIIFTKSGRLCKMWNIQFHLNCDKSVPTKLDLKYTIYEGRTLFWSGSRASWHPEMTRDWLWSNLAQAPGPAIRLGSGTIGALIYREKTNRNQDHLPDT